LFNAPSVPGAETHPERMIRKAKTPSTLNKNHFFMIYLPPFEMMIKKEGEHPLT
jgi:hypothetical protein